MKYSLLVAACSLWMIGLSQSIPDGLLQVHTQAVSLDPTDAGQSLGFLDEELDRYSFFFTAEEHWQSINQPIAYRFLIYLHQQAKVRNLILEGGYSYGFLIDQYLQTGQEGLLLRAIYDTPVCPVNQMQFYKQLYAYNQSLPEKERIRVLGVDVEHSPLLVTECLYQLLPNKPLTAGVKDRISTLKQMQESDEYIEKDARRFYRQWYKELAERRRAYRRFWGQDFWRFEMILENLNMGFDSPQRENFIYTHGEDKRREQQLFKNFRQLYQQDQFAKGGFFAQFGGIHTELKPAINWGYSTFAQQLNEEILSPVAGEVLTISRYFRKYSQVYQRFQQFEAFQQFMQQVESTSPHPLTLVNLGRPELGFPEISRNFPFILVVSKDLERKKCR